METQYQLFGSASSEDLDVVFFVTELGSIAENSSIAKSYAAQLREHLNAKKSINPNLAIVENGRLVKVYKGTVDELNNALFHTYNLHIQQYPQQITKLLPRDLDLKIIRSLRTVLSYYTRTAHRKMVKLALAGDVLEKLQCLQQLSFADYDELVGNATLVQFYKTVAFQMGQTLALMQGVECYTKEDIAICFPELSPYLQRDKHVDVNALQRFWVRFLGEVSMREPLMQRRRE